MNLPTLFLEKLEKIIPDRKDSIVEAIKNPKVKYSFRINIQKTNSEEIKNIFYDATLEQNKYFPIFFTTNNKSLYTKHPWIFSGSYYFQDLASLLPVIVLGVQPGDIVLDACASPGSKSTHILSYLEQGDGLLVANEINKTRVGRLIENIARFGSDKAFICSQDTKVFNQLNGVFDKVLIDAPCSGEGMFYKNEEVINEWSPKLVQKCAKLQKQILVNILPSIKENGELVYSTCTMAVEENEMIVQWILDEYKGFIEILDISNFIPYGENALTHYNNIVFDDNISRFTKRIFPDDTHFYGEAFFVAKFKIKKKIKASKVYKQKIRYIDYWDIPTKLVNQFLKENYLDISLKQIFSLGYHLYSSYSWKKNTLKELIPILHPVYIGIRLGTIKKDWIEPCIELSTASNFNNLPSFEISKQNIESYILGESFSIPNEIPQGFYCIKYFGKSIGIAKISRDNIVKSYFKSSQGRKILP